MQLISEWLLPRCSLAGGRGTTSDSASSASSLEQLEQPTFAQREKGAGRP